MVPTTLRRRLITALVRQAGHPRGPLGRAVGLLFAHRGSNRERNRWVVTLLDVRPTDRVLEVGFGPGIAIAELARRVDRGQVLGVDHSAVMVRQATRRNSAAVRDGRVVLRQAAVDRLPDLGGPVDAALAVNSIGFWPDPVRRLVELRGLLREGGRIALVAQPRQPGSDASTTARAGRELREMLAAAGFTGFRTETLPLTPPVACVLAVNPAAGQACAAGRPCRGRTTR
ncbi:class I SAM-dependent methyltransferase [Pseudonocardia lacus]|uniref:class I SAM-dependent methyltransferase n=1 Tax=Pseudonocardia lacus TaxID=2835865 RepID=UPI001BDD0A6A|nr:class I SAM-dependent methyltransferase [Pseudonocardia lacus]